MKFTVMQEANSGQMSISNVNDSFIGGGLATRLTGVFHTAKCFLYTMNVPCDCFMQLRKKGTDEDGKGGVIQKFDRGSMLQSTVSVVYCRIPFSI